MNDATDHGRCRLSTRRPGTRSSPGSQTEPFARALDEFQPEVWLTGIRREETEHRKTLDIVSLDNRGIIKVPRSSIGLKKT
ncbi:MAG: phosphoadenosine phosphosulfate reductase family protein [Pseudohongiellaceae bacterium]